MSETQMIQAINSPVELVHLSLVFVRFKLPPSKNLLLILVLVYI